MAPGCVFEDLTYFVNTEETLVALQKLTNESLQVTVNFSPQFRMRKSRKIMEKIGCSWKKIG